ncbi:MULTISPECIES: four-helix bundle copper-binding protein [Rufibacter]|uniref:Putative GNAT family N-acyltransferase n=1 Tax=Rufibacter quisquiliarum TaxID=1549639 RepID=A0A839GVF8_9BACT|nr:MULTISPECIES: four-helix bundle copper-binding protein [Rufibacter]MBA9078847.1 putative GNAT family N-acyltransferase [Rufibacter quisquiliarum]
MIDSRIRPVLDALQECILACEHCASSCLQEDNVKMMAGCISLDRDCADICRLTAAFLARGSEHGKHLLKECIEICQKCGDECAQHDAEHCKQCAEACYRCAEACRSLAA